MSNTNSSTLAIPEVGSIPQHIAVIMDGNGRWARKKLLPRIAGHRRGTDSVRSLVKSAIDLGIPYVTLFAFSSENWRRPADEVSMLMQLFLTVLKKEINRLHRHNIRLRVVGDVSQFDTPLQELIRSSEQLTEKNTQLTLTIAANYGGRWDVLQAFNRLMRECPEKIEQDISESDLTPYLSMGNIPEPDLFIRTGGEKRISNFLLWQLAYTELYFTDTLWPDFDEDSLKEAILSYQSRERRFGRTSEQVSQSSWPSISAAI
ncbi:di-trans,poly-cis-decaprenylcistransferase [Ferrovum sp. PN-J185]|uniref:polyprenyl diphosphate synthase n=1 Tax=Ferrovum sp. PN-J185 TaxID=1356306 RepID=UPI0007929E25|nr:polyprenyl diphosphate synthase [Ferrovum sp. PN-J185]KXW56307.1 ditrans,polycis-undecaprenyl-diphosphate synthase ((2E,6E)-farnesyl-diphosphate specific) [Ferrovum sp. PN-J185]MCC6069031.1 di-trans,poly-cis-decaprenylcistransferase [Ferrovum sp. PN-J185]MDE1890989.1 di-trans,poly-cis-decaprenylcistransferase [Betaproteobacteria bacterium]MDE2055699.1 di-trans,poly-cis-decaprenylcistransferase [Betaproteobacteria bacterium]